MTSLERNFKLHLYSFENIYGPGEAPSLTSVMVAVLCTPLLLIHHPANLYI